MGPTPSKGIYFLVSGAVLRRRVFNKAVYVSSLVHHEQAEGYLEYLSCEQMCACNGDFWVCRRFANFIALSLYTATLSLFPIFFIIFRHVVSFLRHGPGRLTSFKKAYKQMGGLIRVVKFAKAKKEGLVLFRVWNKQSVSQSVSQSASHSVS